MKEKRVRLNADCIMCLMKRQMKASEKAKDERERAQYLKEVMKIIGAASEDEVAPVVVSRMNQIHEKFFGKPYSFEKEKKDFNKLMLELEPEIEAEIDASQNPLQMALKYARAGNYIDFGALGNHVKTEKLLELLKNAGDESLNEKEYENFRKDMAAATSLTYLTDNCGEVVLDKIFIKKLIHNYPDLKITVLVRGKPVLNDVTENEAEEVGLTELVTVVGNGSGVAGTWIPDLSEEAREILLHADVILAKGQGNFETLQGCNLNVYYAFLCKCQLFTTRFGMEQYAGVFINDRRLD